jgi:hypothetical protein
LQAQRPELVVAEGAGKVALELVAVLGGPALDELFVEFGVLVHLLGSWLYRAIRRAPA